MNAGQPPTFSGKTPPLAGLAAPPQVRTSPAAGQTPHFMGRGSELKRLEGIYNSGKFECVVVHGRMRVGITALLREFIQNKKAFYFSAQETSVQENLEDLSCCLFGRPRDTELQERKETGVEGIFEGLHELSQSQRVVLVIDNYQYLTAAKRGFSGQLCEQIDKWLIESRLMLIIAGSSEPVMQSETLGFDSPFHGRRTAQIKLSPFTFFETKRFYSGFPPFDIAILYGVTGGVPKYLGLMDPGLPIEENIRRTFFDPSSFLFEEPSNILRREVRDPAYYNAILRAIAAGCSKNSEIAAAVNLETSACTAYLKNLIALGLVGKHTPTTEKAGKKTIYEIEDNMFRFWYRFVPANMSLIQGGMADRIWRGVAREITVYMSKVFEDICRQWLEQRNLAGLLPANFVEIGRWWGIDHVWKTEAFLPIIAYSDDDHAIFGDCVWSDDPAEAGALVSLVERSRLFRYSNRYLYLFSRSGFTEECAELAGRIGENLVTFE